MDWLAVVSRIVHVSTAIILIGGSAFLALVLLPVLKSRPEVAEILSSVSARWKRFVHIGILLFLVSGFYNFFLAIPLHKGDGLYHGLIGTKILLAFGIFFIASALVGRSARFEPMRQAREKWLMILLGLAFAIVAISGYAKVRGPVTESTTPTAEMVATE